MSALTYLYSCAPLFHLFFLAIPKIQPQRDKGNRWTLLVRGHSSAFSLHAGVALAPQCLPRHGWRSSYEDTECRSPCSLRLHFPEAASKDSISWITLEVFSKASKTHPSPISSSLLPFSVFLTVIPDGLVFAADVLSRTLLCSNKTSVISLRKNIKLFLLMRKMLFHICIRHSARQLHKAKNQKSTLLKMSNIYQKCIQLRLQFIQKLF